MARPKLARSMVAAPPLHLINQKINSRLIRAAWSSSPAHHCAQTQQRHACSFAGMSTARVGMHWAKMRAKVLSATFAMPPKQDVPTKYLVGLLLCQPSENLGRPSIVRCPIW